MIPSKQLPVPDALPTVTTWLTFKTRLTNWIASVAGTFSSQFFRQTIVTFPSGAGPFTTGTVPFLIDADTDGAARALLIADNVPVLFVLGTPGALQWTMQVGTNGTTITLGTPASFAWFAFLVAR